MNPLTTQPLSWPAHHKITTVQVAFLEHGFHHSSIFPTVSPISRHIKCTYLCLIFSAFQIRPLLNLKTLQLSPTHQESSPNHAIHIAVIPSLQSFQMTKIILIHDSVQVLPLSRNPNYSHH